MHSLLIQRAKELTNGKGIHITFFDYLLPEVNNLHQIWATHPGDINHMSVQGNLAVTQLLKKYI
jgi:hypothetical protein